MGSASVFGAVADGTTPGCGLIKDYLRGLNHPARIVASCAPHGGMRAFQRKIGSLLMVEKRGLPLDRIVAA